MAILIKVVMVFCLSFFIAAVFWYKSKVEISEIELHKLDTDITRAVDNLSVLRAEWSYLNQPQKLKERNQVELGMRRKTAAEIHPLESIPKLFPLLNEQAAPAPAPAPPAPPAPASMTRRDTGSDLGRQE
ncbi:MAG: hypothetical protein QM523_02855 [Candidatus Pacebacteria bacterium]|nr:hypothetical protein [Candidatus Paceibacterota bacterium]